MQIKSWQQSLWKHIIPVAERVSVEGACIPSASLETGSVPFEMPMKIAKQRKCVFRK
jgi:hypothetical protein